MSRNNTGNPIGSKAFPDFEDNVKNLDVAVNAEQDTFQDRLGKSRMTWAGMENRFADFLQASGYQDLGEYAPGIEITSHNQYVTFGGQPYLLKPSIPVPYTTSGEWTGDDFKLIGDDSLRQDLANPDKGAALVGWSPVGSYPKGTVGGALVNLALNAQDFADTLNEAIAAISLKYAGQRVRVFVPSGMPITDTVAMGTDMDIDWSYVEVINDVDIIFDPVEGWSGSTTPVTIEVNNHSCRIGWNLKKAFGGIYLQRTVFRNIGDEATAASADSWVAFILQNHSMGRIVMHEPTTINSYVVPNRETGDVIGPNRNIVIEGYAPLGSTPSDITIYDHTAINLTPEEDSDSLVINCGVGTPIGYEFNIDIHGGYAKNVQRRMYKIIGGGRETSGIRLHGTSYAEAGGPYPWNAVDISNKVTVDWNGTLIAKNWQLVLNLWGEVTLKGDFNVYAEAPWAPLIADTFARLASVSAQGPGPHIGPSELICNSLYFVGGGEVLRVIDGSRMQAQEITNVSANRLATVSGILEVSRFTGRLINNPDGTTHPVGVNVTATGRMVVDEVVLTAESGSATSYGIRISGEGSRIKGGRITGFPTYGIDLASANKVEIANISGTGGITLIGATGGRYASISNCRHITSVFINSGSNPMQDVTEINSLIW